MDQVECVVAGAGVVGLAIARALAMAGRQVLVLEAGEGLFAGTSGRGSGVIHAGLYYPPGSLKARFCVAGRKLLYDYAETHQVPYRRLGKLVVATSNQEDARLAEIASLACENGVDDVVPLSAADARALEPALACTSALLSPSTGVLDAQAFVRALQDDAEEFGAVTAFYAPLEYVYRAKQGFVLEVGGATPDAARVQCPDQRRRAWRPRRWRVRSRACRQRACRRPPLPRAAISRCAAPAPSRG